MPDPFTVAAVMLAKYVMDWQRAWKRRKARRERLKDSIFVSYRREDSSGITGRIVDRLKENFGHTSVFFDVESAIPPGTNFKEYYDDKLSKCKVFLIIIGKLWINIKDHRKQRRLDDPEDHVRCEVETALRLCAAVVPILVNGAKMPNVDDFPSTLKNLATHQAITLREGSGFHDDMEGLIQGILEPLGIDPEERRPTGKSKPGESDEPLQF